MNIDFKRIKKLRSLIHEYNYEYYINHKSLISDREFDILLKELSDLENLHPEFEDSNSPTKRVGGGVTKNFKTVKHNAPMYSLENTYSREDIIVWKKKISKILNSENIGFTCELKYDGASINITYENGELIRAITRGDGLKGDDVTLNVKTIKNIPLKLKGNFPKKFDIRGEIIISLDRFMKLNKDRISNGENPFMNPRNTASGSLKLQDSKETSKRSLKAYMYALSLRKSLFTNHFDSLISAREWGFDIPKSLIEANSLAEVYKFIDFWNNKRANLNYEIDGVVIKVNSIRQQQELGFTSKYPRWAIAYKFETERSITKIESISYQVGRTGAITPVANLTPLLLSGTNVKRASLHNADQIKKLNLRIGDSVYVEKGGEIIPKIVDVFKGKRGDINNSVKFINNCPECNSKLFRVEGEAQHYCLNDLDCKPQIIGKIQHFISRNAMDIDGIGAETVSLLFENKLIRNIADLYELNFNDLICLDRMAEKSVENLLDGVKKSKKQEFNKVLFGMGIRFVGTTVAKKIVKRFPSIDQISKATFEELVSINDIGERIANSIIRFFSLKTNIELVERLKNNGLNMKENKVINKSNILFEKTIVISGIFNSFSREELKKIIEENGGYISNSISSKTSFLIAGKSMGPAKRNKAQELEVMIIDELDFLKMLEI